MKIVVVGYGEMFDSLVAGVMDSGHDLVGVFRHENVLYNPVKRFLYDACLPSDNRIFSRSLGLYDIKAKSVNSKKFRDEIKKLKADIILVGSWSEKFSKQTIETPTIACVNVHPSLLPKYRGPNPYTQVILNNEKITGISFHVMDEKYDNGAILHQMQTIISPEETGISLKLKCCDIVRKEVSVLLKTFANKFKNKSVQNNDDATYYPQISLMDSILNFDNETSEQIDRKIRALTPWLNCHIPYKDEFFEFKSYKIMDKYETAPSSSIIKKTNEDLYIVCKDFKVIKFSNVKLKRPVLRWFNKLYLKFFVRINSKAI
ncbi:hypothetical protein IJD44_03250 [bacterium]|nr:hypothetical protein [bacterium]